MKNSQKSFFITKKLFSYKKLPLISLIFLYINTIIIKYVDAQSKECPINYPIYKNSTDSCVMEYCSTEQFNNKDCIISNKIIKKQWINNVLFLAESTNSIYSSMASGTNKDILFESNSAKNEKKIFYSMEQNGRGFLDEDQLQSIKIDNINNLFNTYGNSYLFNLNEHKSFLKLSFYESIEIYDLVDKKYNNYKLEKLLGNYHIQSYYNSLLRTNEENTFIYAYITTGNYLAMQKFKIISDNFNTNSLEIIKTMIENQKSLPKNSRKCLITNEVNQHIECLDMEEDQNYYVRLYDINLNFINKFLLEKNISPKERAFSTYQEAILLKAEKSIFIYFTDLSNNKAKPIVSFKKLENNNLVYLNNKINRIQLFTNTAFDPYYFSDTENSFIIINEHYFVFASITIISTQNNLFIALLNLFNNDISLRIHYFKVPLKDLYGINYYSNINSFYYNDFIGVQFVQLKQNDNNINSFIHSILLFSYANTTDPSTVFNIFDKYNNNNNIFQINLTDYINLQNNILCYVLTGIRILSLPDPSTTKITITKKDITTQIQTQITSNEVIHLEESLISISYSVSNPEDITKGNYLLVFEPTLEEPDETLFSQCQFCLLDYFGEKITISWTPDKFKGRKTYFKFTVGNCYKNCGTCVKEGTSENEQFCETCLEGFYFVENTKNCFKEQKVIEKHYFNKNKNIFSQCYKDCKTCKNINENEYKHNCLSCRENYLLYNNSNCLSCKYNNLYTNYEQNSCLQAIPLGYYLNDTIYNTIDKCHQNCLACNKGPTYINNNNNNVENMNCLYCDNQNGFYLLENTNNCYKLPYDGYYLDDDYKIKKCYFACKTCSSGPVYKNNIIENMNCDTCNNELGYFKVSGTNSKNCEFKERIGEYYDSADNKYYPCYRACLTCFNKEVLSNNQFLKMNCLTCNENNGYYLFTKTGQNCLNCKLNGKYLNYDETECLDSIPEGYYISNYTYNIIDKCYSKCKTCSEKGVSDTNMKCDTCPDLFFLENKNCVQDMTCPNINSNFFYFKINLNQTQTLNTFNLKEKKCLENKIKCPEELPFYYTSTKECVDYCPLDFLFTQGCKISNTVKGLNRLLFFFETEYAKGKFNNFSKIFKFNENYENFLMKINIFPIYFNDTINIVNINDTNNTNNTNNNTNSSIRILATQGEINKYKKEQEQNQIQIQNLDNDNTFTLDGNNYFFDDVSLDLNQCLSILEKNKIISNKTNLTMIKIDLKIANLSYNDYYFELFDDSNRLKKINLSVCNENNLFFTIKINVQQELINIIKKKNQEKQANDSIDNNLLKNINDECYVYTQDGADVLVEDRILDFSNNNSIDSDISEYDYEYIKQIISQKNFDTEIGNKCCPSNCNFNKIDYVSNILYLFCTCPYSINNSSDKIIIELPKPGGKSSTIQNNNKIQEKNNLQFIKNQKRKTKSLSQANNKNSISNIYILKCINNISKYFNQNYILIIFTFLWAGYIIIILLYFLKYRKIYLRTIELIKINAQRKFSLSNSLKSSPPPKYKFNTGKKPNHITLMGSNNDIKTTNINIDANNKLNLKKNLKKSDNITNNDSDNVENNFEIDYNNNDNNYENNFENNFDNNNFEHNKHKCITLPQDENMKFSDMDIDLVDYNTAITQDTRKDYQIFLSISQKRQIFIFCFKRDHNIKILKISLILFCLINYFAVNLYFFNNRVIHKIFLDKGKYNFGYQIKFVFLSSLISCIFLYIAKYIFTIKKSPKQLIQIIKCIDVSLIVLIVIFTFYWIYIGSFFSVFIKTQKHLMINFVLTIIVTIIYECILTLVSCVMRRIAIKKKNLPKLYELSLLLVSLK